MTKLKVLGICAGNGVCLFPFANKNFEIIGNIEPRQVFHTKKEEQWSANFDAPIWKTYPNKTISRPHIIIGHPDCGANSKLRLSRSKKNISSSTNPSVMLFIDSISIFKPDYFLLENLPSFLKAFPIAWFQDWFPNYVIYYQISSVCNYGNSQRSRERLVIVGKRKDLGIKTKFKFPKYQSPSNSHFFELGKVEDIEMGHVREPLDKTCNLYWKNERKITYQQALKIWQKQYYVKSKWYVGGKMVNQPGVSRNLANKPPFTVRKQNRQFNSDGYVLSPREMANIQGLPYSFKIHIDPDNLIYWLNKARTSVTKCMPYEIADWFKDQILSLTYSNKRQ